MIDIHIVLKKKTELLCKGVYLDERFLDQYHQQGIDYGRKGGAGPLGGRYFLFEDQKTLVNIALWNNSKRTNLILEDYSEGYFKIYNTRERGDFGKFKLIKNPLFYDLKTIEGYLMKQIALVHGIDCLGSTIYQKCRYWGCGDACKFCGIELSLDSGATILEKSAEQISEVAAAAKKEGRCSHMTLTSGTTEDVDKGADRYIELLKGVKKKHPDVPIHVQIEPIEDLELINKLKEAGADTIGIHIEILDDLLRKLITPGKYKISYKQFEENWKHAIDIFGPNQVDTYILTGFGESSDDLIDDLEKVVAIGVIPYITPVRSIPNVKSTMPVMNYNALLEVYNRTGKLMKSYGINPFENKAGCVKCGGCSAINEAYKAV